MNNRQLPRILTALLLAASLVACGDKKEPAETPQPAPSPQPDTAAAPSEPMVTRRPGTPGTFADEIHAEYAAAAVSIPHSLSDSIIQANKADPRKIEKEMTRALHKHDSVVRAQLAAQHGISLDSLNAILKKKEAEREEE